jgi:hypothetical protein
VGKARPLWEPNDATTRAFGVFKAQVAALGVHCLEDKAGPMPRVLEVPLGILNTVVQREHGWDLKRQTGYHESVSAMLGGNVSIGKLKKLLLRMHFKDAAEKARVCLERAVAGLVLDIRAATVPYNHSPRGGPGSSAQPTGGAEGAADCLDDDDDVSIGRKSPPVSPGRTPVTYNWHCRWAAAMRAALEGLEGLTVAWVDAENRKRKALTVEEKREEGIDGLPPFDPKEEMQKLLRRLCEDAFPSVGCKGADIGSLRKIIVAERKKRMKASEELQAKAPAVLTTSLSGVSDAHAAATMAHSKKTASKELKLTCKPRLSREFVDVRENTPDDFLESTNLGGGSSGVKEL